MGSYIIFSCRLSVYSAVFACGSLFFVSWFFFFAPELGGKGTKGVEAEAISQYISTFTLCIFSFVLGGFAFFALLIGRVLSHFPRRRDS